MKRREFMRCMTLAATGLGALAATSTALARIGRPATPGSVAGVRRRTRRRTRRRVAVGMSYSALPYGCATTVYRGGINYYYCGGIYYKPVYQGTTVVYVVDEVEPGADTMVEFEE